MPDLKERLNNKMKQIHSIEDIISSLSTHKGTLIYEAKQMMYSYMHMFPAKLQIEEQELPTTPDELDLDGYDCDESPTGICVYNQMHNYPSCYFCGEPDG